MRDVMEMMMVLGSALAVIFLVVASLVVSIDYLDCRGFEKGTGIKTKWSWGCYAEVDGKWVPKQYAFGDAHELRVK